jgi:8-oxo-dGTP pyrophosphatase MutT (NUDIX family)
MVIGRFLAGVGAVIWSPARSAYLLMQRAAQKDFAPGAWDCVTGRVDQGESFEVALRREVREELGAAFEIAVDFIIGTSHFYRGTQTPEHELLGVVYHCSPVGSTSITLSVEHSRYRWVSIAQAQTILRDQEPAEAWLKRTLVRADAMRALLPPALLRLNHTSGFELG